MTVDIQEILIHCSTTPGANNDRNRCLQRLVEKLPHSNALLHSAVREGMTGLLYQHLRKAGLLNRIPEPLRDRVEIEYYKIAGDNLRLLYELKIVQKAMNRRDLPFRVLQGMALLDRYGDIGLRPMNDIDLWITAEDHTRVEDLLVQLEYHKDRLYPGSYRKGTTKLDLRTHLFWADRIRSRRHLLAVDQEEIFRDSAGFVIDDCPARRLMPYDEVIYLTMHAIKHFAACLIWLVDLRLVTSGWTDADWRQCLKRAAYLGQANIVSGALFLLRDLFGNTAAPINPDRSGMPVLSSLRKYLLKQRKKSGALAEWAPLFLFETDGGVKNRLHYQTEHLFPRPDVLRQVFPARRSGHRWLLYGMRFLQLYGKAIRSFTVR